MANWRSHPLDRVALSFMLGLSVLILLLIGLGDHTIPKVREFSWQNHQVGAEDRAFILTFNRPMDWAKIQENLTLSPPIEGKVSWSGRRMAYTLSKPLAYGQSFELSLKSVPEKARSKSHKPKLMQPFEARFQSRDRAFAYIGSNSGEAGRLILSNLSSQQTTVLSPPNLEVTDFKLFPSGDRILFAATERQTGADTPYDPKLFTVTTGLATRPAAGSEASPDSAGTLKPVLADDQYQILKFDLSMDGEKIVVQRAQRSASGAIGQVTLWQAPIGGPATQIKTESGGDFDIAPDGQTLVIAQGQGLGLIPLNEQQGQSPLDFLPEFGTLLGFSQDGSTAATVKFNNDYTRSLFMVNIQGEQIELLRIEGGIIAASFDPQKQNLYCLLTRVKETPAVKQKSSPEQELEANLDLKEAQYQEEPYLAVIDLKTKQLIPILDFSQQPNINMSLAPDGRALLFDHSVDLASSQPQSARAPQTVSHLWMLPLDTANAIAKPQPVKIASGSIPKWLP